ncbi:hypothetical protein AB0K18_45985 [Nonomuraea sp. NPDC049421]|uniref:hypothetical protein n=1 Tax=Nonomuraea sp. NPDC049421 TaxID=3155275 RepID=UPI00342F6E40
MLLALMSAAACATPAPQAPAPPIIDPSDEARALRLPFDAYKRTEADIERAERAVDVLTSTCLKQKGYDRASLPPIPVVEAPNRRRYGVIEPVVAEQAGYQAPYTTAEKERERADRARGGPRTRKEQSAANDCIQRSTARVYVTAADSPLLTRLEREIFEQTRAKDARVRSAFEAWRSCLRTRGQKDYPDPLAAAADERWQDPSTAEAETAAAVADVACKKQTNLVTIWSDAERKLQTAALKEHATEFTAIRQALERERTEAARIAQDA